jgi:hypothetical protein
MTNIPDQPGTIVTMLGDNEISRLIAWCSDGLYSHIGMVIDGSEFVEAGIGGVRSTSFSTRMCEVFGRPRFAAWRTVNDNGSGLDQAQIRALSAAARAHVGRDYDTGVLVQLGMVVMVKRRVPRDFSAWPARALIIAALDHLVNGDRERLTCSELVYRAFSEAGAMPDLRPPLGDPPRLNQEFPDVDWAKFACEVIQIYKPDALPRPCRDLLAELRWGYASVDDVLRKIEEIEAILRARAHHARDRVPQPSPNAKVVQIPELTASTRFVAVIAHP